MLGAAAVAAVGLVLAAVALQRISDLTPVGAAVQALQATIKTHLLHIYDELGVRDRAAAVGEAYRRRLLP